MFRSGLAQSEKISPQKKKRVNETTNCAKMYLKLSVLVFVLVTIIVDTAVSDYENTWNLYYEQPCCGGSTAGHHLRHHRGI